MRHIFVRIGASTGMLIESVKPKLSEILKLVDTMKGNSCDTFIGVYKDNEGKVYIEESTLIPYNKDTLNSIIRQFPNEECFYQANVVGQERVEIKGWTENDHIYHMAKYIFLECNSLRNGKGLTYNYQNGHLYRIITKDGECVK